MQSRVPVVLLGLALLLFPAVLRAQAAGAPAGEVGVVVAWFENRTEDASLDAVGEFTGAGLADALAAGAWKLVLESWFDDPLTVPSAVKGLAPATATEDSVRAVWDAHVAASTRATIESAIAMQPDLLWSRVLARKGPEFRKLSRMPYDPSMN